MQNTPAGLRLRGHKAPSLRARNLRLKHKGDGGETAVGQAAKYRKGAFSATNWICIGAYYDPSSSCFCVPCLLLRSRSSPTLAASSPIATEGATRHQRRTRTLNLMIKIPIARAQWRIKKVARRSAGLPSGLNTIFVSPNASQRCVPKRGRR
jgi:hypothetical protein